MIKHIVMWRLKDAAEGNTKAENAALIKERLEALNGEIEQIVELEVGVGIEVPGSTHDAVLYSVFNSQSDLDSYQNHPMHKEVGAFIKLVASERSAVDYFV